METITLQQKRKRKALLVLPLPVICFATILFHVLGGGTANAETKTAETGLNKKLPDAHMKKDQLTGKLAYYNQAAADSAKDRQLALTDPYGAYKPDSAQATNPGGALSFSPHQPDFTPGNSPQANARKIGERLNTLQQLIDKPNKPAMPAQSQQLSANPELPATSHSKTEDPELKQMNGLLEKILDIQHPERVQQKTADNTPAIADQFKAIPAVIEGTQKIVQGTVIKLRLLDSVRIKDQLFPKGTFIYGSGDLYNQRYKVNIKLIRQNNNIIPVDLTIYDMTDGLEGISVPEAITGDALKDGAVGGVQNMDVMSFDPSVGAQITTAGINTAKGLFSKKIKRVKGKIKDGHQVLLRDNKALQNVH